MKTKGIRKTWTSIVLDADERAYVEQRAARDRVSLAQVVRWCVRFAMASDTTNTDTTNHEQAA